MTRNILFVLFATLLVSVAPAGAQDRVDVQGATIVGDSELPKILYIVPWRSPFDSNVSDMSPVSLVSPRMAPLDRDEFRRMLDYEDKIRVNNLWGGAAR
ncbi:MAG: hypothetical protein FD165_889 [Gammaproteobacteria bacterium]|nr:MAG: hypothetical protein FD165_889 [Gammaproteobacteria bacterium]TND06402.1 MAG: hypothetical protein FD120_889 [Gammaproteobacteria bacterium]